MAVRSNCAARAAAYIDSTRRELIDMLVHLIKMQNGTWHGGVRYAEAPAYESNFMSWCWLDFLRQNLSDDHASDTHTHTHKTCKELLQATTPPRL